jgi:hypothetical protein
VVSEARLFEIFFQGNPASHAPVKSQARLWLDGGRRWFFKIVHPVSTAAELQQVKTREVQEFCQPRSAALPN